MNEDSGIAFMVGIFFGFVVGCVFVAWMGVSPKTDQIDALKSQIYQEAITQHDCKPQSINKGSEIIKDKKICVMPDGTILDMQ